MYKTTTPLHTNASIGCIHGVDTLLKAGADVNIEDERKRTPLHCSVAKGHKDVVEILLKDGANVNAEDFWMKTPVYCAVANGHKEIVKILLKAGANVNAEEVLKRTPLYCAVTNGHKEIVKILLKAGADIHDEDGWQKTPLLRAAGKGHKEIVEILIKAGANVNAEYFWKSTPLHAAADNGHKEIVEILLKAGANINSEGEKMWTPLHVAAGNGHKEIVEILLKAGANVNAKDDWKRTPQRVAADNGHREIVAILVQAGAANINVKSNKSGAATNPGVFQALIGKIRSSFVTRTVSHTQTTKIVHVKTNPTHSEHSDTRILVSESMERHCEVTTSQAFTNDQQRDYSSVECLDPCTSDSLESTSTLTDVSTQQSSSGPPLDPSLLQPEIRKQFIDHLSKFSPQYNCDTAGSSTDVTSELQNSSTIVINAPITLKFISHVSHYQQESLEISHADFVAAGGSVKVFHNVNVESDSDTEEEDNSDDGVGDNKKDREMWT